MGIIIRGRKKDREREREFKGKERQLGIGRERIEKERVVKDQEPKKGWAPRPSRKIWDWGSYVKIDAWNPVFLTMD